MGRRLHFYIGKKDPEVYNEDLDEWLCSRIPPPPSGVRCESEYHGGEGGADDATVRPPATTSVYRIDGDHVCYSYVCDDCADCAVDPEYLADHDYPITASGYAVSPRHCA